MRRVFSLVLTATILGSLAYGVLSAPRAEPLGTLPGILGHPEPATGMRLWEAYARGYITVEQVDVELPPGSGSGYPLGYRLSNFGPNPVVIDEYAMLLSHNPAVGPFGAPETTQDGVVELGTIAPGASLTYYYGEFVLDGTFAGKPIWYCTEQYEYVVSNVVVNLGGEILPFVYEDYVVNNYWTNDNENSQKYIWRDLKLNPTVVVGKTPFLYSIMDAAGQVLSVRVSATNLAVKDDDGVDATVDAIGAAIVDTVPPGWSYDPLSFSRAPNTIVPNGDGSTTLLWIADIPAADVAGHDTSTPPPYGNVQITYNLVTPALPAGRLYLPRAQVDKDADGTVDAHSEEPLVEVAATNRPPTVSMSAVAGVEGSPITLTAAATDPNGDPLTYSWDFDNDGIFELDTGASATASHTWGDDYTATVRVRASDGALSAEAVTTVTVGNAVPTLSVTTSGKPGNTVNAAVKPEGTPLAISFHVTDPGSDDETVVVDWDDGTADLLPYLLGATPDPPSSPEIAPRDLSGSATHTYGDDATLTATVTVTDDDGGMALFVVAVTVTNVAPQITVTSIPGGDEGSPMPFTATATDAGSDDLTFFYDFNDGQSESRTFFNNGAGPDPDPSLGGTFPFTATDSGTHVWGDDGTYDVTLIVTDDDGGSVTVTQPVPVANVPPAVSLSLDAAAYAEASPATATADFSDPGSDDVTLSWSWAYGPAASTVFYNDGVGPDPPKSPAGVFPFSGMDALTHTYGDNGDFTLTVEACDDDGGCSTATAIVPVVNVAPTIDDLQAYIQATITLRVAGEKWHDIRMDLVNGGVVTATASVTRYPGSPDRQTGTITGGRLSVLGGGPRIVVYYTPDDDPINGQRNGDNPVWVILTFEDGTTARLFHNFNVQHPATWTWRLDDLLPYLVGKPIHFEATGSDVGSDDLTFGFDFGDGSSDSVTVYNDGLGPDPFPSPEVNPIAATATTVHTYAAAGTYTLTVTLSDDDGGADVESVSFTLG